MIELKSPAKDWPVFPVIDRVRLPRLSAAANSSGGISSEGWMLREVELESTRIPSSAERLATSF